MNAKEYGYEADKHHFRAQDLCLAGDYAGATEATAQCWEAAVASHEAQALREGGDPSLLTRAAEARELAADVRRRGAGRVLGPG